MRFGAFEADLEARELRKQGMKIKLQDQPFQLLVVLLECAGEIVTREQLRQKLWPKDTFVDVDNSVNAAINRLREALHDTAESPRSAVLALAILRQKSRNPSCQLPRRPGELRNLQLQSLER